MNKGNFQQKNSSKKLECSFDISQICIFTYSRYLYMKLIAVKKSASITKHGKQNQLGS